MLLPPPGSLWLGSAVNQGADRVRQQHATWVAICGRRTKPVIMRALALMVSYLTAASAATATVFEDSSLLRVGEKDASKVPETLKPPTPLKFGAAHVSQVAEAGQWIDFYVDTDVTTDHHSIAFEVVATTSNPAGIGIYVFDSHSHSADSLGLTVSSGAASAVFHPRWSIVGHEPANRQSVAAIDVDDLSRIGNYTHRTYHAYVPECYLTAGSRYFLSVYAIAVDGSEGIPVSVRALLIDSRMTFKGNVAAATGQICDDKYAHHFFDFPYVPASGGIDIQVSKTSGELDSFHVRLERCAGLTNRRPDPNLYSSGLFQHGLSDGRFVLPDEKYELKAARYYVSVKGSSELCGEYAINVKNESLTSYVADVNSGTG